MIEVTVRADGPTDVVVDGRDLGTGVRIDVTVRNPSPHRAVHIDRVELRVVGIAAPTHVLEHGHQSWSVVRRTTPQDVRPERQDLPDWVRGCHHSDPDRAGHVVAGDQFLVTDTAVVGFLDANTHLGTVETDATPQGNTTAVALLDGVPVAPSDERALEPLWIGPTAGGRGYSELATHWGETANARIPTDTVFGWCSWYEYFADVTPADIRTNLAIARDHGIGLVQIDDGYQSAIGDWLTTAETWREGTAALAHEIRATGATAGIWTAPFLAAPHSDLLAEHPDWTATHHSGHPAKGMYNPGGWGGFALVLDTTRPDVLDHLRTTFAALVEQGFDYHKIDFCYAAALPAHRSDPTKTRAESLRMGLDAIREGIGDDSFLLGCGCPIGPAVGVVDAMRVSPDVAPRWAPDQSWPGLDETAPAARNAVSASTLRAPLHRRLFLNDPDCLLLRPTGTHLDDNHRRVLTDVVAGTGAFLMLSDDLARYGDDEWDVVHRLRDAQGALDSTTLDLVDPFAPEVEVRATATATSLRVDWSSDEPTSTFDRPQS